MVDYGKTEGLTSDQLKKLLDAIDKSSDIEAANIMRIALFTGMRRGELFKLKRADIDFDRGFITITNPKEDSLEEQKKRTILFVDNTLKGGTVP